MFEKRKIVKKSNVNSVKVRLKHEQISAKLFYFIFRITQI